MPETPPSNDYVKSIDERLGRIETSLDKNLNSVYNRLAHVENISSVHDVQIEAIIKERDIHKMPKWNWLVIAPNIISMGAFLAAAYAALHK
jgi:hypothetical protein